MRECAMKLNMLILLLICALPTPKMSAQSLGSKEIYASYGTLTYKINEIDCVGISTHITRQNILTPKNFNLTQKTVSILPKYRYELVVVSETKINNIPTKTWMSNIRIYINNVEITRDQFLNGFMAIIETKPTTIYKYDTHLDTLDIKFTWDSLNYYK